MSQETTINLSRLRLPSDTLTIGVIRRFQPELFRAGVRSPESVGGCVAFAILDLECRIAERAYESALGHTDPYPAVVYDAHQDIESLITAYVKFGLSEGEHHARQLVRTLQSDAAIQAKSRE